MHGNAQPLRPRHSENSVCSSNPIFGASTSSAFLYSQFYFCSHYSVNGCLAPLCSVDGLAVTTVEGLGTVKGGLDPVQVRIFFIAGEL